MLKIRGGKYLHRVIEQPDMSITRPTKDSAKEGIFNSLGSLRGLSFLDLFSGSGQMGIEAISRGAEKVVANDINRSAYNIIQGNLKKLGINEIKTYNLDYKNCLKKLSENNEKFDIVVLLQPTSPLRTSQHIKEAVDLFFEKDANSNITPKYYEFSRTNKRPTQEAIDHVLEDDNTDIEKLFDGVMNELATANATKIAVKNLQA